MVISMNTVKFALIATALLMFPVHFVSAADFIDIKVQPNDAKSDGLPWDGCPSTFWDPPMPGKSLLGNIMYNPAEPNPPEIRLMTVRENGRVEPHANNVCNDTLSCEFLAVPYNNEVIGFILFDADISAHDLIEAVVLVPSKQPEWRERAQRVRQKLEQQLPRFMTAELNFCRGPRAPKKIKVEPIALDECSEGIGCQLGNSFWTVGPSDGKRDDWKW